MKKRVIRLIAGLLLTVISLASCGETTPTAVDDTSADSTTVCDDTTVPASSDVEFSDNYVIVRPDTAPSGSECVKAASKLKDEFIKASGLSLALKTDWLNARLGETPSEFEILIGATNREETAKVSDGFEKSSDFSIAVVGKKLVIAGGSEKSTAYAVDYFIENLMTGGTPKLASDFRYDGVMPKAPALKNVDGMVAGECSVTELYDGVTSAFYSLSADSKYGLQKFTVVDFDPQQADLYFKVTMGGETANKLVTVKKTVELFNKNNGEGLTAITAVNGDLWMTTAHGRVLGKGNSYKDCTDDVVTKSLTIPRGFNMYDGEIITSAHMTQETPYEGAFYSFGITDDGTAVLGNPQVGIKITSGGKTVSADGLNRLPANNALVMYSDVYSTSNYSLSDAYEVVIDCPSDYKVCHGAKITGTVTAVTKPGETHQDMKENRVILTARGNKTSLISGLNVGDTVEINITVTDQLRNNEVWQNMKNAVGGHIPVIINGKSQNSTNNTTYPMSVLGITDEGHVVMLTNDGRQGSWSVGIKISDLDELCVELGIVTAFILDGGGSAEMVNLNKDGSYSTVNKPSDGSSRSVVNSVILAYGPKKTK